MLEKLDQNNILQVIFPWEDDCVLWANIAQVIFVCNAMMYLDNIGQMIFLWNAGIPWDNIAQSFYLCNVVPRVLKKHSTWFFLMQCCLEPSGQHYIRLFQCNFSPGDTIGAILLMVMYKYKPYAMLSMSLSLKKILFNIVLYSWNNIAEVKILLSKRLQTTLYRYKSCAVVLTLFKIGGKKAPSSFSPAISTNVGISHQNFLTFSFNLFATLV